MTTLEKKLSSASKELYKAGKLWVKITPPNPTNIVFLTIHLVKEIQKCIRDPSLGEYKKELVISVLKEIINNEVKFDDDIKREAIIFIIDETMPATIDMTIGIAKGDFDLGKKFKRMRKGCTLLCC